MKRLLFFFFCLSVCCYSSEAQKIVSANIVESGLFNVASPDTLINPSDTIHMKMGNSFGFHYKIIADPDNVSIPVTLDLQITDRNGKVEKISTDSKYLPHEFALGYFTFVFEAPEEMVAGIWKFSLVYKNEVLLEKVMYVIE